MDLVDAGNQANKALDELDGSHNGLNKAHVKIRDFIYAAYNNGLQERKRLEKEIKDLKAEIQRRKDKDSFDNAWDGY